MIRLGPCGIPLSCKGRTTLDGIEDIHTLGLNAFEIQFIRVNITDKYASDEVGMRPKEVEGGLVVEVLRTTNGKQKTMYDAKIQKGDILRYLNCGIAKNYKELALIGEVAKELDVKLSLHAPYYIDLADEGEVGAKSMENIKLSGILANALGAWIVVTNLGLYKEIGKSEFFELMVGKVRKCVDIFDKMKLRSKLGIEISGKQKVFGSLDEALRLCKRVKGTVPVINFAHHHSREYGILKKCDDFENVFDAVSKVYHGEYYTHFSGVEHEGGNEKRYTPVKRGDLRFELLAEVLVEKNPDMTIISSSPLLEHDAIYMRTILERIAIKKLAKSKKEEKINNA